MGGRRASLGSMMGFGGGVRESFIHREGVTVGGPPPDRKNSNGQPPEIPPTGLFTFGSTLTGMLGSANIAMNRRSIVGQSTHHPPLQEEKEPGVEFTRPATVVAAGGGGVGGGAGDKIDKTATQPRPTATTTANQHHNETDALITTPEPTNQKKLEFREVKGTLTFKQKACFLIADGTLSNRKMLQVLLSRRGIGKCLITLYTHCDPSL